MDDVNRRMSKSDRKAKKSRLIIRNLSFKTKEEDIRKLFGEYGNIVDISFPLKPNGSSKGFSFLSFDNVASSLKAIKFINGKKHLNRQLAVDFAVPKNVYTQQQSQDHSTENQHSSDGLSDKKDTEQDDDEDQDDDHDGDGSDDNDNDDDIDEDEEDDVNDDKFIKKARRKPSDVNEGKTIFIRNLDLDTTEDDLLNVLSSFGKVEYCKICLDAYSGKSKGSAFVKFIKKQDADKCLEEAAIPDNVKFYLDGKQLILTRALSRHQVEELREAQTKKHKDKRNLYLAKEGLIYPDSPAAVGVSQNDLKKRLMLEEKKRRLLQNLHYFISDRRLCVHNLPANYDDDKLRKLFLNAAADNKAKILWAKVMRNKSKTDNKFGKSKGFGFVEFEQHIHALKALRHLNNNPEIFTVDRRPIVEFSIENKVALNRKKYRLLKQEKLKNDNQQQTNADHKHGQLIDVQQAHQQQQKQSYSGVNAKPFEKNEKVIKPSKLNRKIMQHKKKLQAISKKNKHLDKRKKSAVNRDLMTSKTNKTKTNNNKFNEQDELEIRYSKRKANFMKDTLNGDVAHKGTVKKQKWYL